jgi:hypothetical protein
MPHYHPTLAEIWTYPAEELAEKIAATHWLFGANILAAIFIPMVCNSRCAVWNC